jgi:hypothetical protein
MARDGKGKKSERKESVSDRVIAGSIFIGDGAESLKSCAAI